MADSARITRRSWSGSAFIIEALVLLVFVAGSLAVMLNLFADAYNIGKESRVQAEAITLASNAAEAFAADPRAGESVEIDGDYIVACQVSSDKTSAGILYYADIYVYGIDAVDSQVVEPIQTRTLHPSDFDTASALYSLQTARYISGVK